MNQLTLISADDWEGIYLDGELLDESHEINKEELVRFMRENKTFDVYFKSFTDEGCRWVEDRGHLPSYYGAIPPDLIYQ